MKKIYEKFGITKKIPEAITELLELSDLEFDPDNVDNTRVNVPPPPGMKNYDFSDWVKLFENCFEVTGLDATLKNRYLLLCIGDAAPKIYADCKIYAEKLRHLQRANG